MLPANVHQRREESKRRRLTQKKCRANSTIERLRSRAVEEMPRISHLWVAVLVSFLWDRIALIRGFIQIFAFRSVWLGLLKGFCVTWRMTHLSSGKIFVGWCWSTLEQIKLALHRYARWWLNLSSHSTLELSSIRKLFNCQLLLRWKRFVTCFSICCNCSTRK